MPLSAYHRTSAQHFPLPPLRRARIAEMLASAPDSRRAALQRLAKLDAESCHQRWESYFAILPQQTRDTLNIRPEAIRDEATRYALIDLQCEEWSKFLQNEYLDQTAEEIAEYLHKIWMFRFPGALRAHDYDWWRRHIKKTQKLALRALDIAARDELPYDYSSERATAARKRQIERNQQALDNKYLQSDSGDLLNLGEMAKKQRLAMHAERNVRLYGMAQFALLEGYVACLVTTTCPSRFHPNSPKYDADLLPHDGAKWLTDTWTATNNAASGRYNLSRDVKKSKKQDKKKKTPPVRAMWFRVIEPHKDECPHQHLIMFIHPDDVEKMHLILLGHYLYADEPTEPGASKRRVEFSKIKPRDVDTPNNAQCIRAAVAYALKYVDKGMSQNDTGEFANGLKIDAWKSDYSIRGFAFGATHFRLPSITLWRELRRDVDAEPGTRLAEFQACARANDYAGFLRLGLAMRDAGCTYRALRDEPQLNQYDEPQPGRIIGVTITGSPDATEMLKTRSKTWKIVSAVIDPDQFLALRELMLQEVIGNRPRSYRE